MSCQPPNFPSPIHFFLYAWVHLLSMQMYACMHLCIHSFTHALRVKLENCLLCTLQRYYRKQWNTSNSYSHSTNISR